MTYDKYNNEKQITESSSAGVTATRVTVLSYQHETIPDYEAFNKNLIVTVPISPSCQSRQILPTGERAPTQPGEPAPVRSRQNSKAATRESS
jgi:hypothetical protein